MTKTTTKFMFVSHEKIFDSFFKIDEFRINFQ